MRKIKQIKRIAAVVMAVSVAVGLTACQQKTDSQGNSSDRNPPESAEREEDDGGMHFVLPSLWLQIRGWHSHGI